jgi:hypothetical protein
MTGEAQRLVIRTSLAKEAPGVIINSLRTSIEIRPVQRFLEHTPAFYPDVSVLAVSELVDNQIKVTNWLDKRRKWNHLKDIPFPDFTGLTRLAGQPKVSLVLGADQPEFHRPYQAIFGSSPFKPVAQLLSLGWVAMGTTDPEFLPEPNHSRPSLDYPARRIRIEGEENFGPATLEIPEADLQIRDTYSPASHQGEEPLEEVPEAVSLQSVASSSAENLVSLEILEVDADLEDNNEDNVSGVEDLEVEESRHVWENRMLSAMNVLNEDCWDETIGEIVEILPRYLSSRSTWSSSSSSSSSPSSSSFSFSSSFSSTFASMASPTSSSGIHVSASDFSEAERGFIFPRLPLPDVSSGNDESVSD